MKSIIDHVKVAVNCRQTQHKNHVNPFMTAQVHSQASAEMEREWSAGPA